MREPAVCTRCRKETPNKYLRCTTACETLRAYYNDTAILRFNLNKGRRKTDEPDV